LVANRFVDSLHSNYTTHVLKWEHPYWKILLLLSCFTDQKLKQYGNTQFVNGSQPTIHQQNAAEKIPETENPIYATVATHWRPSMYDRIQRLTYIPQCIRYHSMYDQIQHLTYIPQSTRLWNVSELQDSWSYILCSLGHRKENMYPTS
jgi:hypothetical protein